MEKREGGREQSRPYKFIKLHGTTSAVILSAAKNLKAAGDSSLRSE
jgi:hypothetical protein